MTLGRPLVDIDALENCTCFNLRKAARAVTQMYDEAFRPMGLRATQVSLLAILSGQEPATMTQLAKRLGMDRTTLTRNLKPLIAEGLVAAAAGEDKRERTVQLTALGQDRLLEARPIWRGLQHRLVAAMGRERWAGLLGDLTAAADAAQSKQAGAPNSAETT